MGKKGIRQLAGEVWASDFYFDGKRIRESFGKCTEEEALRALDELKARLWNRPRPIVGPSWQDAKIKWIDKEPRPEQELLSLKLLDSVFPNRPLVDVTAKAVEDALSELVAAKKWTAGTYNRYVTRVVAIANLSGHAIKVVKKNDPKRNTRVLSEDEWLKLRAQLLPHMRPMVIFALYTGLRQANVTQLRWDHVDLKREMVMVDPQDTKEKEPITIPLAREALEVLQDQRKAELLAVSNGADRCDWVFPYHGRPITNVNHAWHLAMERAGLGHYERWTTPDGKAHEKWEGDVVWHTLRHSWASWQRVAGTAIEDIQALGGWKDARSVKRYAHVNVDHLRRAARNIKPWDRDTEQSDQTLTKVAGEAS